MSNGNINAKQIKGVLDIENGGTGNPTFSTDEFVVFGTQSLISSGNKLNDLGTASNDIWSAEQIITYVKQIFQLSAGRNNQNTTDSYLHGSGGIFTDLSPYYVPYNCVAKKITVTTFGDETWVGELYINGVSVESISITATDKGSKDINVNISDGDLISMYCAGTNINRPFMTVWFEI